jgi:VanZ like family
VIENQHFSPRSEVRNAAWSNRILILAVAGILFLTLYPFRFDFHTPPGMVSPFLLGKGFKVSGLFDAFLNVLLFAPFGFGLAEKLRERGKSRRLTFVIAIVAGALFSYTIEFLQIYIPDRDSGWEDVVTNSTGSILGLLLFEGLGRTVLPILSACERALTAVLSGWRVTLVLLFYFGFWFAASIHLQRESRLSNWNPDSLLVIGNDAAGKNAWTGQIRLVQIGDRAISNDQVEKVLAAESLNTTVPGLRASFDLSSLTPLHDQLNFLPDLVWTPRIPAHLETNSLVLDGSSWLSSSVNVADLIQDLRRSNQFTIRIVCTPGTTNGVDARILSVSPPSGLADLTMRQEGTTLVFWFRNGISVRRSLLAWRVPDVLRMGQVRDVLYSYDGSNLSLYIDGKLQPVRYKLGPGAALAAFLLRVRPNELNGYNDIYYALVFFFGGVLLGTVARQLPRNKLAGYVILGVVTLAVPLFLELVLVRASGHRFSLANVALSVGFLIAGALWLNADRGSIRSAG